MRIATFEALIESQHQNGFWKKSAEQVLSSYFTNGKIDDGRVKAVVDSVSIPLEDVDKRSVYLTLLALYILREVFGEKQTEWMMIEKKARDFLTKQVTGWSTPPMKVLKQFSLQVR